MGKSAIAQTVAEKCEELDILAATFFFYRLDTQRNRAERLVASIALQLCESIPELVPHVEAIIRSTPTILTKSLPIQLKRLIIDPMRKIPSMDEDRVVIIDGLDECVGAEPKRVDPAQEQLLVLKLIDILVSSDLPLCFLICCRPESWIKEGFESLPRLWRHVEVLDLCQHSDVNADIETYFRSEFGKIREQSKLPMPWPAEDDVKRLIHKASGQFIYAATVIRYIDDPWSTPTDRLKVILSSDFPADHNPLEALDNLYLTILSQSPNRELTMQVLGCLKAFMEGFFVLEEGSMGPSLAHRLEAIRCWPRHALRPLHSVVKVDAESVHEGAFFHATFVEFLDSPARSNSFHIPRYKYIQLLGNSCLFYLVSPSTTPSDRDTPFGVIALASSCCYQFWTLHDDLAVPSALRSIDVLNAYLSYDFSLATEFVPSNLHYMERKFLHQLKYPKYPTTILRKARQCIDHFRFHYDRRITTRLAALGRQEIYFLRRVIDAIYPSTSTTSAIFFASEIGTRNLCIYLDVHDICRALNQHYYEDVFRGPYQVVDPLCWPGEQNLDGIAMYALLIVSPCFVRFLATRDRSGPHNWHIIHESQLVRLFNSFLRSLLPLGFRVHSPGLRAMYDFNAEEYNAIRNCYLTWMQTIFTFLPFIAQPERVLPALGSFCDSCQTLGDGSVWMTSKVWWEMAIVDSIFRGNVVMASALLGFVRQRLQSACEMGRGARGDGDLDSPEIDFWKQVLSSRDFLFEEFEKDPEGFVLEIGAPRFVSCGEHGCDDPEDPGFDLYLTTDS
ncbi:hypothetical protein FA15DRAFT_667327 [Coprinopsis marcescibilis]|uniref:Nephrocystin 3-like N-terminal domain-containing protein n=1 Tax=Coprinopsis marcescibilis TaxID=230819 RepID=A0A5C3L117_COPMA|nr:hypothetical protein FA15DRAFT_667327 [Coprinopsis marcescibilis]